MKLVYVGESPGREVPFPGGCLFVERGVPFDVSNELGIRLLEQPIFVKHDTKKESDQ